MDPNNLNPEQMMEMWHQELQEDMKNYESFISQRKAPEELSPEELEMRLSSINVMIEELEGFDVNIDLRS